MTPEQQRIAIAEACGWKRGYTGTTFWVCDPHGIRRGWSSFVECTDNALPNYPADLNAMHEAEKVLLSQATDAHGCIWRCYETQLAIVTPGNCGMFHITAAQRAKAFLRAIGKWKD